MGGTIISWIAFFLFLILFAGSIVAEVQWMVRKGWTTSGRATGFVFTTDMLSFAIGGVIFFVAFFGMFMMVMGPAGRGGTAPEAAYWAVSAVAFIVPAVIFFLIKLLFLFIFKIKTGKSAWAYSLVTTIVMMLVVAIPPLLLYAVVMLFKL